MIKKNIVKNLLSGILNGQQSLKKEVSVLKSDFCVNILKVLERQGYIRGFVIEERHIKILLKYIEGRPVITKIHKPRISTISLKDLRKRYFSINFQGLGTTVLTTPKGIITSYESIEKSTGGKVLFTII